MNEFGQIIRCPADGIGRQSLTLGFKDRIGVKQKNVAAGVAFRDGLEIFRLIINVSEHAIASVLKVPDSFLLGMTDALVPSIKIHVQQPIDEADLVVVAERIQRAQGIASDGFMPAGI